MNCPTMNNNDDKTLPFLPLYMECTPRKCLQAWARDGPLRRCMTCPLGAYCTSEEGQFGVVSYNVRPKWGYWRIPWAVGKPLNETFVSCDGDEDCLGAPELSSDIVFREIIGLGPHTHSPQVSVSSLEHSGSTSFGAATGALLVAFVVLALGGAAMVQPRLDHAN